MMSFPMLQALKAVFLFMRLASSEVPFGNSSYFVRFD